MHRLTLAPTVTEIGHADDAEGGGFIIRAHDPAAQHIVTLFIAPQYEEALLETLRQSVALLEERARQRRTGTGPRHDPPHG